MTGAGSVLPRLGVLARAEARTKPAGMAVEIARNPAALLALEAEWRSLELRSEGAVFFQSFDWCKNHVEHAAGDGGCRPFVLVARERGEARAILPLALQSQNGMTLLTGLSEPFQQYTDLLTDPCDDPVAAFSAMLPHIKASGADGLHLCQVRGGSNLHRAISGRVEPSGEADGAPFVQIGDWPDFAAYHQTVNAKTRKNMRNARNRLEREAPVSLAVARSGSILGDVIDRSFRGREAWLEKQGLTSRAFRDTGFGAFVRRFKDPRTTGVDTIAFALSHGGRPLADQWGFVHKRRYYAFMARWEEGYEEASPGKMHLGAILETCHGEGIDVADFLIPAARYKFTWAREAVPVQDYTLPLSIRGRIYNDAWLKVARPLAKRTMEAMPAGLRGAVLKALLR